MAPKDRHIGFSANLSLPMGMDGTKWNCMVHMCHLDNDRLVLGYMGATILFRECWMLTYHSQVMPNCELDRGKYRLIWGTNELIEQLIGIRVNNYTSREYPRQYNSRPSHFIGWKSEIRSDASEAMVLKQSIFIVKPHVRFFHIINSKQWCEMAN